MTEKLFGGNGSGYTPPRFEKATRRVRMQVEVEVVTCPRCGWNEAHFERQQSGIREILVCIRCGFIRDTISEADPEEGTGVDPHPSIGDVNNPTQRVTEIMGFGGFRFGFREGGAQSGPILEEFVDEEAICWFSEIVNRDPDIDLEISFLAKWDKETGGIIYLGGCPQWSENLKKRNPTVAVTIELVDKFLGKPPRN